MLTCSFINMNRQEQSVQVDKSTGPPRVDWCEKIQLKTMLALMRELTLLWKSRMQYGDNDSQIKQSTPTFALPCFSHPWTLIVKFPYPVQVVKQCYDLVLLIILCSQRFFLLTQLKTMVKWAIWVLGKCDSSHRLHRSEGSFAFSIHWKTQQWVFTTAHCQVQDVLKTNLTTKLEINKGWSWPKDGELAFWMPMQPYMFMQHSIIKEGGDLNIEIHKESRRRKIITLGRISEGDLLCEVNIKFDVLWKHLVLESQKESKCELIFALIGSNMLKIPQQTSQWNSVM